MVSDRIIIFGASGHVGSELCRLLAKRGHAEQLVMVDHKGDKLEALGKELNAHCMTKDAKDPMQVRRCVLSIRRGMYK